MKKRGKTTCDVGIRLVFPASYILKTQDRFLFFVVKVGYQTLIIRFSIAQFFVFFLYPFFLPHKQLDKNAEASAMIETLMKTVPPGVVAFDLRIAIKDLSKVAKIDVSLQAPKLSWVYVG